MKLNARILAFQRNDAVTRPWVYVQR